MFEKFGEIGWAGNGGFHALNLAIQFGASRVFLVGFDMSLDHGYHWHGRHQDGLSNPKQAGVDRWREIFDAQKPILDRLGIDVLIASPNSRLTAFRRVDFSEVCNARSKDFEERRATATA